MVMPLSFCSLPEAYNGRPVRIAEDDLRAHVYELINKE